MHTKQFKTRVKMLKDADGAPTGEVTAIVSVFGNVDLVGDRVVKGAFSKALQDYKDSGDPIPMIWSHDWSNPMSHIGEWDASKAVETDEGLELTGKVHINEGNPVADQAFRLMEKRLVREFSFAYDVLDEQKAADGANELLDLTLIEAGPTLKGANSETRLVAAKAMESALKAGRVLSAKNETGLREALDALDLGRKAIQNVLSALDAPEEKDADADTKDVAVDADAEVEVTDESDAELEQEPDGTSEVDEVDEKDETDEPDPITLEALDARLAAIEDELRIDAVLAEDSDDEG
jgi:HK97 family phage prohead protease